LDLGILHTDLVNFIETNLPKKKKQKILLGVADFKIGQSIVETFPYLKCLHVGAVTELLRIMRLHSSKATEGLSEHEEGTAQLGLGHSYSRAKVIRLIVAYRHEHVFFTLMPCRSSST